MNTTEALFIRWMAAKGHTSQRAAARALKVSPMGPINWKNGSNAEIHIIERMANDLGEDAASLVIQVFQETQKGPNVKTMQRVARKLGVAAILLALSVPGAPTANAAESIHYAKPRPRRIRRKATPAQGSTLTAIQGEAVTVAPRFSRRNRHRTAPVRHPRPSPERLRPFGLCA